ncbi:T9SS type B sorting domain-containing protein [Flavobacterium tructae]
MVKMSFYTSINGFYLLKRKTGSTKKVNFVKTIVVITLIMLSSLVNGQCTVQTINADFEYPAFSQGLKFINQNQLPVSLLGWRTTATDDIIEFWANGNEGKYAYSGRQFVELNAYQFSGLYQDYDTSTTTYFNYSFAHMGRLGVDKMALKVGPPGGPYTTIMTASTGTAWKLYTGTYQIPKGLTKIRFIFEAISTSTGDPTIGNFLDAVNFTASIAPPSATDKTICNGTTTTLTATGIPNAIFYWYDSTGTNLLYEGPEFTTPILTTDTNYKLKVKDTISNCESNFVNVTVKIENLANPLTLTLTGNSQNEITANASGGKPVYQYSINGGSGGPSNKFTIDKSGTYTVTVTDASGCSTTVSKYFEYISKNDIAIPVAPGTTICYETTATLTATGVTNATFYWYDATGTNLLYEGSVFTTPVLTADTTYKLKQKDSVSNTESAFLNVEVKISNLTNPLTLTLTEGEQNEIVAIASGGTSKYEYSLNGSPSGQSNRFVITESGIYTVIVTDENGCAASTSKYFEYAIKNDICILNYFTPNGDGINDEWAPGCLGNNKNLTYIIFDRYGRTITTNNYDQKWDGRYNGAELPSGDYWYEIILNAQKDNKRLHGHFTLYR